MSDEEIVRSAMISAWRMSAAVTPDSRKEDALAALDRMANDGISAYSLRKMLGFIAADLAIDDGYGQRNAFELTREIRKSIDRMVTRLAELEMLESQRIPWVSREESEMRESSNTFAALERADWGGIAKAAVAEREKRLLEEANPDTTEQKGPA